jgi:hypothetical protein
VHWVSTMQEEMEAQYTDVRFYTYLTHLACREQ